MSFLGSTAAHAPGADGTTVLEGGNIALETPFA